MRTFWLLCRAGFRRQSTYRLAMAAGSFTNSVFGCIRAAVVTGAIASAGTAIGGYTTGMALAFVWWGQALLGTVNIWGFSLFAERVRTGDVAIDFIRPINPQFAYLAEDLGRASITLVARGVPTLLIGALLFDLASPPGPASWVAGIIATVLAVVCSFAGSFIINLTSLWLTEIRGIRLVWMITSGLLCGLYLPVPWFPDWLRTLAQWSPFPSMLQHPIDIFSGRIVGTEIVTALASQVFWAVVLLGFGQWLMGRGRRRLEVQGG